MWNRALLTALAFRVEVQRKLTILHYDLTPASISRRYSQSKRASCPGRAAIGARTSPISCVGLSSKHITGRSGGASSAYRSNEVAFWVAGPPAREFLGWLSGSLLLLADMRFQGTTLILEFRSERFDVFDFVSFFVELPDLCFHAPAQSLHSIHFEIFPPVLNLPVIATVHLDTVRQSLLGKPESQSPPPESQAEANLIGGVHLHVHATLKGALLRRYVL